MRRNLTGKQERFCLFIFKGETQSKAYEKAGYKTGTRQTNDVNASKLLRYPNVAARVAELRGNAVVKAGISLESLTSDALAIRDLAMRKEEPASATGALTLVARLHGFLVDHKTVDIMHHKPAPLPTKLLELTEDEWKKQFEKKS
jgi:hypothetical protein